MMCPLKNTVDRYGLVAIFLHWLIAILILGQIYLGWYMSGLASSPVTAKLYGWHKEIGVLILMLVAARIVWRSLNVSPSLDKLPKLEKLIARGVLSLLYFFMIVIPLTGWLMSSAAGYPVSFFGWFVLPDLVAPNAAFGHVCNRLHTVSAYALLVIISVHVAGALKHHFIDKDNILRRMFF